MKILSISFLSGILRSGSGLYAKALDEDGGSGGVHEMGTGNWHSDKINGQNENGIIAVEAEHALTFQGWRMVNGLSGKAMQDDSERGRGWLRVCLLSFIL